MGATSISYKFSLRKNVDKLFSPRRFDKNRLILTAEYYIILLPRHAPLVRQRKMQHLLVLRVPPSFLPYFGRILFCYFVLLYYI